MITKIAALPIENNKLLVVFKPSINHFITLGGKLEEDENDLKCLEREISEEIPDALITKIRKYKNFRDKVIETDEPLLLKTYIVKLAYYSLRPSGEISEILFLSKENYTKFEKSCAPALRNQIIPSLIKDNFLEWL